MTDRRLALRYHIPLEAPRPVAKLRPGREATLLDVSGGGARIESEARLLPGTRIELRVLAAGFLQPLRGRILRARVARLKPDHVWYEAAVKFDEDPQLPPPFARGWP